MSGILNNSGFSRIFSYFYVMDEQLILERFFQVIALGLRHRDYKHVVKKRKLYMQLVAGIEIDKLLRQYVKREDGPLFKQRVALTHHH